MGAFDAFRYDGKRVLVVGGATGMGEAAAELAADAGAAEVVVLDVKEITSSRVTPLHIDLSDRASIDETVGKLDGAFDAVFSCAGVADDDPTVGAVNYVGHRYLLDQLLERDQIRSGGAIGMISSTAGIGWQTNITSLIELLGISDFDEAWAWLREHGMDNYSGTKQAVCAYVAYGAISMLARGIRVNAICPGPTDTPLARANAETWLGFGTDFREVAKVGVSTPMEQAYPLVFLCSDAAKAVAGLTLVSDVGWLSSADTGSFPPGAPIAAMMLNRPTITGVAFDPAAFGLA